MKETLKMIGVVISIYAIVLLFSAPGVTALLIKWTPLLFKGFLMNIYLSVVPMSIGILIGSIVGALQLSKNKFISRSAMSITLMLRNVPWLAVVFLCVYLIPHRQYIAGYEIIIADSTKAVLAFSLVMIGYVSEVVRGAILSIDQGQFDAAKSLGLNNYQMNRLVIFPQCVKRSLPPLINIYTILLTSTVLASVIGVPEILTFTSDITAVDDSPTFFVPLYLYVLIWFFVFCYPITRYSKYLETKTDFS